jgi:hypothetical protein
VQKRYRKLRERGIEISKEGRERKCGNGRYSREWVSIIGQFKIVKSKIYGHMFGP